MPLNMIITLIDKPRSLCKCKGPWAVPIILWAKECLGAPSKPTNGKKRDIVPKGGRGPG